VNRPHPPAVLLGGDETAVPVARSLGRAGIEVHALGGRSDPVRRSRYCSQFADLGGGEDVQERWLDWLRRSAPAGAVVLPCADEGLELVARNRAALLERDLIPIEADDAKLLDMLDKERTHELAVEHGIPVPRTMPVNDCDDIARAAEWVGFPCALKPLQAHEFRRHFHGKGFVADTRAELDEFFRATSAAGVDMLVTEMVRGPDRYHSSYTYLDENGESLWTFTKQKLRQYPVTFGAGVFHIMDWNEEVSDLGLRFCQSVGLRGLLNVEFKRDSRDGRLILIECNHRFTASSALHLAAGLDVPLFTYNRLTGAPLPRLGRPYDEKLALWYPLDDFRAFRDYRRDGEMKTGEYVRSLMRPMTFSIFSWSDPAPVGVAMWPRFKAMLRKIGRRAGLAEPESTEADGSGPVAARKPAEDRSPAGTRS
jgi:D-aspartate ligase